RSSAARNTPTDVGKTRPAPLRTALKWKHPHGRGEDSSILRASPGTAETPPRTWGRRCPVGGAITDIGNTPTDVGKTPRLLTGRSSRQKHPHGRGEDGAHAG